MIYQGKTYKVSRYNSDQGRIASNAVGRDILVLIANLPSGVDLDTLLEMLMCRYKIDKETLKGNVLDFTERCIQKDILVNENIEEECDHVIQDIRTLQDDIPGLTISDFGYVARLGISLTPGCQSCYRGKWAVLFVGMACNLNCFFCPYSNNLERIIRENRHDFDPKETISFLGVKFHSYRELQFQFSLIKDKFDAFAWVGGEPMLPEVQERILPLIRYFHEAYPDYHQWIYTNGTMATKSSMQALYDSGIRELRFNLAATDFSPLVLKNMNAARQVFDYLCIEIPMLKKTYDGLIKNIQKLLDTGLDQMNLAEFMVGQNHLVREDTLRKEGKLYNYRGFITSPISSRRYTYEIMKKAYEEKWPVVINDCSNEYKYYKLSVQQNKGINIFQGLHDYWNNNYSIHDVDEFNDKFSV